MATAGRQGASCWAEPGPGAGRRSGRTAFVRPPLRVARAEGLQVAGVLEDAVAGLRCCHRSLGGTRAGAPGSPEGTDSHRPGLEQDKGGEQLPRRRRGSWGHKKGMLLGLKDTDFTAASLQRHQILGHSSRAQPASLGVSPSPRPWTGPRCQGRGCSAEAGSEIHDRRSPSPSEGCHL